MGKGLVSGNNTTANRASTVSINASNKLALNLYGGTYTKPNGNANPVAMVGLWDKESTLGIYGDATISGDVGNTKGTLYLGGNSTISGKLSIGSAAKLVVKTSFGGIATVSFEAIADVIPEANGISEGAFSGKLYLDRQNGALILGQDGKLVIQTNE